MTVDTSLVAATAARNERKRDLTSRFFQLLSDPTRVHIVELLLTGEKNVSELVAALEVPQGRVSSHLACLRWCGFIGSRRDGKYVYYRVTDERVRDLVGLAHQLLADNAGEIASCFQLETEHTRGGV
ncbi:MAG: ArsR/SmtB family transcription factor [Dehalococcoidia bacterium]